MRPKGIIFILALPAIGLALAWAAFHSRRETERALADFEKSRLALDSRVEAARDRIAASGRDELALKATMGAGGNRPAGGAERRKPIARPNVEKLLATNPQVRAAYERSFRANLSVKYLPLYQTLGLSPAQIESFESLITEREQERLDLLATAQAQGLTGTDPAIAALRQQQDAELRQAETALLGDAGYQQLQQFDRTVPLEAAVTNISALVAQTSPLSGTQMTRLLGVLANASGAYQSGASADVSSVDGPAALAQAGQFLNESQLQALKAFTETWQVNNLIKQYYQMQPPGK